MSYRKRSLLLLAIVVALASALTLLLAGTSAARPAPQTSPLQPSPTATRALIPTVAPPTRPPGLTEPASTAPAPTFPALEPPTSVPLPTSPLPSATVSGFLPAPTITNPDDVKSLPLARPPGAGGGGGDEPFPSPTPRRPVNPALAASVAILNVLWLICGGALVLGGVAVIIVLARRRSDI